MARTRTPEEMIEKVITGGLEQQGFVKLINSAKKAGATHVVLWRLQDEGMLENNRLIYAGESPEKEADKHDNDITQVVIVPLEEQ